jgi:hypothetical protein
MKLLILAIALLYVTGCARHGYSGDSRNNSFAQDVEFLKAHSDVVVLSTPDGDAQVVIVPKWQGRVMTSTAGGNAGNSYGWINYELIESGQTLPHINVFGGEDRFWLGPEGGQYAVFFKKGDPFDLEHWQTPALIDTDPFNILSHNSREVSFRRVAKITNASGTTFDLRINRTIRLLGRADIAANLGIAPAGKLKTVAYESENTLTNIGDKPWTRDKGLLSIWILGMFKPAPTMTIVAPYIAGPEQHMGLPVNDAYFGKVPPDRLIVDRNVIYFKGDGQYRSKIGLSPKRAKSVLGSYDPQQKLLTIVQFRKPDAATDYVNSMWAVQKNPFGGDVTNSYNDGPPAPDKKPLGPFYELETSSPAAALVAGDTLTHTHRTYHFEGDEKDLDVIARNVLGVSLEQIGNAFVK